MTSGMDLRSPSFLSRLHQEYPERPGNSTQSTTQSGWRARASSNPSLPSGLVRTPKPRDSRAFDMARAKEVSLSMRRTFFCIRGS